MLTIFDWPQGSLGAIPFDRLMVLGLLAVALILIAVVARVVKRVFSRSGARERQLATLAALGPRAIEAEDLSDLLDWVASRVGRALDLGIVELLELDGDQGRLHLRAGRGFGSGVVGAEELDLAHSPRVKEALDSRRPVVLQLGRRRSALDARLSEYGARSGITVSIPGRALGFGALGAHSRRRRRFRAEEIHFLEATASLLGIAIEARRTEQEARVNQRALALLNEAGRQLAACLEPASVLEALARVALPSLGDFLLVDLVGEEGRLQRLVGTRGDPQSPLRRVDGESLSSLQVGRGANGRLGVHRARCASDATEEELQRIAADPEQLELLRRSDLFSVLFVPLEAPGGVLGSLCLGIRDPRSRYGPAELALASDLARRVAIALDKARLYGERAEVDPRKAEFLGMLTRELRDSIATLSNTIEVLRLGEAEGLQSRAFEVAARQVGGMNRLVADLLDVSRGTPGTIELHREPLELGALVQRAVEVARPALVRAQEVELVLPDTPLWVDGDSVRLEQIVATLLDCLARSAGREMTIRVRVQAHGEGKESVVRFASESRSPALSPRSSGPSPSRAESPPEPTEQGVEFYLVRCLAELHGGEICLENGSEEGEREFVLQLPSIPAPVAGSSRSLGQDEEARGVRILVVDDHEDLATGLAELLERWGHEARVAFDGPSALEAARGFQPELVLLDLGLPGMDGYAVAETFRQEPSLSGVEVAALTGYAHADDRRRARESGIDHYFTKPIDLPALRRLLESRARKASRAPSAVR